MHWGIQNCFAFICVENMILQFLMEQDQNKYELPMQWGGKNYIIQDPYTQSARIKVVSPAKLSNN